MSWEGMTVGTSNRLTELPARDRPASSTRSGIRTRG